jgi:hypothetical protein
MTRLPFTSGLLATTFSSVERSRPMPTSSWTRRATTDARSPTPVDRRLSIRPNSPSRRIETAHLFRAQCRARLILKRDRA